MARLGRAAAVLASGSRSLSAIETPLVIPQGLWFAGLAFFVAVAVLLARARAACLPAGDLAGLFEAIGSKSAVAEAAEEIVAVEHALDGKRGE